MNFEFSEDVAIMREEVRRLLVDRVPPGAVRQKAEAGEAYDKALWEEVAALGWMGVTLSEEFGGSGMNYEPLCMLSEEIGRAGASIPFSSSIYLAAEAISLFGREDQKRMWLPRLASGEAIGAFAIAEGVGTLNPEMIRCEVRNSALAGYKGPVWDGMIADLFIVVARQESSDIGLYVVSAEASARKEMATIEFGRGAASIEFCDATAELLPGACGWNSVQHLLDRAAVLFAFEAIGGAQRSLEMAVEHAKQRYAFGRPIASMQAIKHMLADVYVAIELAKSNAYYGIWALGEGGGELALAAASARLAANRAYQLASAQSIQVHGGMGFTQEVDCHIHYRRSKRLATEIGGDRYWNDRLIAHLPAQAR